MVLVEVISRTSGRKYEVDLKNISCTCPDYIYRKAKVGGLCKHINQVLKDIENKNINFLEHIRKNNDVMDFLDKYGEQQLVILKRKGDVIEKGGKLLILE